MAELQEHLLPAESGHPESAPGNLWQAPIRIPLRRSRIGRRLHMGAWGCALLALIQVQPGVVLLWLSAALPIVLWQWRRNGRQMQWSMLSTADGGWQLIRPGCSPQMAWPCSRALLHPLLIVLVLRCGRERVPLVLFPDSLPTAELRRLRARLSLIPAATVSPSPRV